MSTNAESFENPVLFLPILHKPLHVSVAPGTTE